MKFQNSKVSLKGGGPLKSIEFDILRHLCAYLAAKPPSLLTCAFRDGFILGFVNERLAGQFIMVIIILQWRKFEISVDGREGRKLTYWRHFKINTHLTQIDVLPSFYLAKST